MEMEQPYWTGIDNRLADGIQFVENHAGLTKSTERSSQRPPKKRRRFSRVLDTQIRILVSPPPPARPSPPLPPLPPPAQQSPPPPPAQQSPPPPPAIVDDSQFDGVEFQMSPRTHLHPLH